jgi:aryl carrier-like protein
VFNSEESLRESLPHDDRSNKANEIGKKMIFIGMNSVRVMDFGSRLRMELLPIVNS